MPTEPRCVTALFNADTANEAFMHEPIEYPTILFDHTSLMAQKYNFPSSVRGSVMSFSHSVSAASAVN